MASLVMWDEVLNRCKSGVCFVHEHVIVGLWYWGYGLEAIFGRRCASYLYECRNSTKNVSLLVTFFLLLYFYLFYCYVHIFSSFFSFPGVLYLG